jgi:hypothetical protein
LVVLFVWFWFLVVLGFELRASCLLGRCSIMGHKSPAPHIWFSLGLDLLIVSNESVC